MRTPIARVACTRASPPTPNKMYIKMIKLKKKKQHCHSSKCHQKRNTVPQQNDEKQRRGCIVDCGKLADDALSTSTCNRAKTNFTFSTESKK